MMVYLKNLCTKSISEIPDPPQVDVGARRADVLVLIRSLQVSNISDPLQVP